MELQIGYGGWECCYHTWLLKDILLALLKMNFVALENGCKFSNFFLEQNGNVQLLDETQLGDNEGSGRFIRTWRDL